MKGDMLDSITVSISTMMLVIGIEHYMGDALNGLALPMIIVGLLILVLGKRMISDFDSSFIKRILTNSVGLTLLLTGAEIFLDVYMGKYAWVYIILALVIFHYRNELTNPF